VGQKLAITCSFVGWRIIAQQEKASRAEIPFQNQKNYSIGYIQILLFFMQFDTRFLLNQQKQQCLPQFE
jgi:hypothetical protein